MNIRMPDVGQTLADPIELVGQVVDLNDWRLHHAYPDEISVEIPAKWSDYAMTINWQDEYAALHINVRLDIVVMDEQMDALRTVINTLNQHIWMGHFVLLDDASGIVFKHTLSLRGAEGAALEQIEDLVDITLGECERAYPALFQVAADSSSPEKASLLVLMETLGSA